MSLDFDMKYLIGAVVTFALLAVLGEKERIIQELAETLEESETIRAAMGAELAYRAGARPLVTMPFKQANTGH